MRPTNLADLGSQLDVLLRTALDLLLGRHVGCELVLDWRMRGGDGRTFGGRRNFEFAGARSHVVPVPVLSVPAQTFLFQLRSA
jgi:hypothetical protein